MLLLLSSLTSVLIPCLVWIVLICITCDQRMMLPLMYRGRIGRHIHSSEWNPSWLLIFMETNQPSYLFPHLTKLLSVSTFQTFVKSKDINTVTTDEVNTGICKRHNFFPKSHFASSCWWLKAVNRVSETDKPIYSRIFWRHNFFPKLNFASSCCWLKAVNRVSGDLAAGARPPTKIDCKQKRRNLKRSNLTQHSSKDSFLSNYGHASQIRSDSAVASFCLKNLVLQSRNMISWHMIHICRYAYMHICTRYTSMHVH